jgi:lysophospholipase L1-like esterase
MLWIVGAAAAVLLCVGVELAARFWIRLRERYYVGLPGLRLHLRFDRTVLPEYEPVIRIEMNSNGERGAELGRADHGIYRVLAVGGSPVEGYSLDQASNWPAVLERMLGTPENLRRLGASAVHVGTVARSGIASRDLDLILRRVLPQYRRLHAVLVMIGGNDVANWLACGAPVATPAPPVPTAELFACHPEGPFGWHPSRSAFAEVLTRARRLWLRPITKRCDAGRWIVKARAMRAQAAEIRTSVSDPMVMLDNFEKCLRRLLQRARAKAPRVLVVRQPWFETDYTPEEVARIWHGAAGFPWKKQEVKVYYALEVVNRLMALVDARAARVAEQLGLEQLDLRSVLEPGIDIYYDYVHYTPAGARTVAGAVAAALLRQPALETGPVYPAVAGAAPRR